MPRARGNPPADPERDVRSHLAPAAVPVGSLIPINLRTGRITKDPRGPFAGAAETCVRGIR